MRHRFCSHRLAGKDTSFSQKRLGFESPCERHSRGRLRLRWRAHPLMTLLMHLSSSGKDIAFSQRERGFDSRWVRQSQIRQREVSYTHLCSAVLEEHHHTRGTCCGSPC